MFSQMFCKLPVTYTPESSLELREMVWDISAIESMTTSAQKSSFGTPLPRRRRASPTSIICSGGYRVNDDLTNAQTANETDVSERAFLCDVIIESAALDVLNKLTSVHLKGQFT